MTLECVQFIFKKKQDVRFLMCQSVMKSEIIRRDAKTGTIIS